MRHHVLTAFLSLFALGQTSKTQTLKVLAVFLCGGFALLSAQSHGAELNASFNSVGSGPMTASAYMAAGNTLNVSLNFVPPPGCSFTVVKNTGNGRIQGVFDNLAQNQQVDLSYGGITYSFIANYFGGDGNDLVLQ